MPLYGVMPLLKNEIEILSARYLKTLFELGLDIRCTDWSRLYE